MEELKDRILRIFRYHTTPGTALSRRQLEVELMTSDRVVRKTIEQARDQGIPIVSSSHGKGYWLNASDYETIYLPEVKSRLISERRKIDAYYRNDSNQISIFEVV